MTFLCLQITCSMGFQQLLNEAEYEGKNKVKQFGGWPWRSCTLRAMHNS